MDNSKELKKDLGMMTAMSLVVGCVIGAGEFDLLTDLGVFSCWIFYTLTFLCVTKLCRTRPELER